jgi:two-component system NtrC family sensor kinase
VGNWEYGDLQGCIEGALAILGSELNEKVALVREYGKIPAVRFKEQQMLQVFINLLSNAAQAIEKTGRIVVKTYAQGKHVFIEISDTGCGIPAENLSKVFDPFFTTKPVGQGTGLGLSVVHGIIEQHKGTITVKSQLGQGTTFAIKLLRDGPLEDLPKSAALRVDHPRSS